MNCLITAGPTHEPIDPVRYIGNRSSGKMGAALAVAALHAGHRVTLIVGPVATSMPADARRIDIQTAAELYDAVLREFPSHDLLIMAAAVADYRPAHSHPQKLPRHGPLTLELEPTADIVAAAARTKRPNQRIIGFSLDSDDGLSRATEKLTQKNLDLIVYNPIPTINSDQATTTLLWPDGRREPLASRSKADFAELVLERATDLFGIPPTGSTRH